ncbi:hypothetical protein A0H81_12544 [Grifola frondosa]|uniref:F-box domain-containing protein n=1 Tax=Grifola frondosa TaxID=5627 RepID=A0A1C7LS63_GRIFR|nr:hypothetical protein A0H81_12544 [Grifola frondosa]
MNTVSGIRHILRVHGASASETSLVSSPFYFFQLARLLAVVLEWRLHSLLDEHLPLYLQLKMVPVLPPEVTDCIIDALHDRQTLCSCALTCRNWLPASRYNLFYRITINKRPNYDALLWEDKERPWVHVIPHVFSIHLRNVRFLTIGDFIWDTFRLPPSFYTLGTHFTSVSTLELCSGRFSTFSEFRRLICAFPQLSRLFVQDTEWSRSPRTPLPSTHHAFTMDRPRLELLWFDSAAEGGVITLLDWLLRTPSAQSISDLQLWTQGRSEFVACENILESLGPSLEHFQLSLDCRTEVC